MARDPNRSERVLPGTTLTVVRVSLPWFLAQIGAGWTGLPGDGAVPSEGLWALLARRGVFAAGATPEEKAAAMRAQGLLLPDGGPYDVALAVGAPATSGTVTITPGFEAFLVGGAAASSSMLPLLAVGVLALGFAYTAGGGTRGLRGMRQATGREYDIVTGGRSYTVERMGGKRYYSIIVKDRGTVVGEKHQTLKRGKVVSEHFMVNTDYLRDGGEGGELGNVKAYWTVVIPYSNTPTEWHPKVKTGTFSKLTRGAFSSQAEARAWATSHLRGNPYSIRRIK